MDANKMYGDKARLEQHKNPAGSFNQILEATSQKTASLRTTISHLTNHPNKTNKTCKEQLEKQKELISDVFQWTPSTACGSVS